LWLWGGGDWGTCDDACDLEDDEEGVENGMGATPNPEMKAGGEGAKKKAEEGDCCDDEELMLALSRLPEAL